MINQDERNALSITERDDERVPGKTSVEIRIGNILVLQGTTRDAIALIAYDLLMSNDVNKIKLSSQYASYHVAHGKIDNTPTRGHSLKSILANDEQSKESIIAAIKDAISSVANSPDDEYITISIN